MKQQLIWTMVWLLSVCYAWAAPPTTTGFIRIDQFGYLPNARKVAVVVSPQVGANAGTPFNASTGANQYQVRRWADDAVVFTGTLQTWGGGATQVQSGDKGWWFDFSAVNVPGSYYVFDLGNNVGSYRFEVGNGVYTDVLKTALRTFYYQRINGAKQPPYTDPKWADGATHEGPGQDRQATSRYAQGDLTTAKDLHGGWMDAGDMNKYVTFAEEPVGLLLESYRLNPSVFTDNLNIPESGNGIPDVLDEAMWELDFMRRMQDATGTGGLLLKVGVVDYNEANPPSADRRPRYYVPECTASTLSGAAMFATAGAVLRTVPTLTAYAQDMTARAERAFARARIATANFTAFEANCDDQVVKAGDADRQPPVQRQSAIVAAVYLFEATGKAEYKAFIDAQYTQIEPISNNWWGPYAMHLHVALLRYAANPAATPTVATAIRAGKSGQDNVLSVNDYTAKTDLYRAQLGNEQYHWGSNQVRANAGAANLDFVAFNVNPANRALYKEIAGEYLHWFHGVNAQGKVMLSNMYAFGAENALNEVYHVWFADGTDWDNALTSPKGPVPGYVPVGPQNLYYYQGSQTYLKSEPLQKRYKDWNGGYGDNSWELTEVAIYNQAAYINLLSRLMLPAADPTDTEPPTVPGNLTASELSPYSVKLSWTPSTDNRALAAYEVYQNGSKVAETTETNLPLSTLSPSTSYTFTVRATDVSGNRSAVSNAVVVTTPAPSANDLIIYGDALRNTFTEWSWNSSSNFANTSPVKLGSQSVNVAITTAWGALSLRNADILQTASYPGGIQFWFYGTEKPVRVTVNRVDTDPPSVEYTLTAEPNTWTLVRIPWSALGSPSQIQRLSFMDGSGGAQRFYLDDIRLVAGATTNDTQAPAAPTGLTASNITASGLTLTWTASADNVGVTGYDIVQGSTVIGTTTGTTFSVSGLSCNLGYTFSIRAKDAAGNVSVSSNTAFATTAACPSVPPVSGSDEVIYNEALNPNWQEWGWSVTSDYAASSPVKVGQKALSINYTDGWGGWAITRNAHVATTPQTTIRLWLYATTAKTLGICTSSENDGGLSPYVSFQPTPNAWQEVVITMPQLGNPAKIKRLTIQSQAPGANLIYVDNVRFEGSFGVSVSNVTTTGLQLNWTPPSGLSTVAAYAVYQNGNLLNSSVMSTSLAVSGLVCGTAYSFQVRANDAQGNALVTSVPLSATTTFCPGSSTVELIYDEAFNPNWADWSWGVTENYGNTSPVKVGQKSASLVFDGWGGWSIFRNAPLATTPQTTLKFWLYAATTKTLTVTAYTDNDSGAGTTVNLTPTPSVWQEITLTMGQLGNPARIKRIVMNLPTFGPAPIFLDQVRFETPNGSARVAMLTEGDTHSRMTLSPNPTDGPVRVQVQAAEAGSGMLSVMTLTGTAVLSQAVSMAAGVNEYALDVRSLPAGTYLVQWQTHTQRLVQRLVKR
ncbi:glycoside hydrolase family 9 protein [Fibrella aquatilis]|uniref:Glycoside hydrolase family 9 protein n=1 Tax=Fibrella aquatilis TaxID=2817059 RepID=A0A939JUX6_9BACT|nr:glycoside hydrolase family 9 protein [Fibrella aquatilis]MBO0930247.1 glycoside hydrolase family 9 protein [Fibrella aquatilis]